ncbi:MAG: tetratricopeptide repeat protein [Lentisphaeria bacterium]|nr:tetratricopeptide repeat protein [Candidatus Neomarinimicrobiota bacterium]MCF7841278.1 tetratricopeptide repeat protein [Lentisphaeria bacterium]
MKNQMKIFTVLLVLSSGLMTGCEQNVDEVYRQAVVEAELGSPIRAMALLNSVQQKRPGYTDAYLLAGKLFRENGNYEAAIDQYKRGLLAGADTLDITVEIGQVYLQQNNHAEAYKYFDQALNLEPANVDALIGMAKVLYEQKLFGQAQSNYQKALSTSPGNYTAMIGVAYAYLAQNNVGGAREMFQKAIDSNPVAADAYVGKAMALAQTEDIPLEMVQEAFEQARKMDAKNQKAAKQFISFINKPAFDLEYRIEQTKSYLKDFPDDDEARQILGELYIQNSRAGGAIWLEAAEQTYKNILSTYPENHLAHARLAAIYLLLDKPQLARLRAKMAFEINPTADYAALVSRAETAAQEK